MEKIKQWLKSEFILAAALLLAAASMVLVPPDAVYAGYIDWRVLATLFCLMTVMQGFQKLGVFGRIGGALVARTGSVRALCGVLIFLCFFGSMLVTNDVSLLTFVPFALCVLHDTGLEKWTIFVLVLQRVAANLGSMLTPIGNPQNIYLFGRSGLSAGGFVLLMLPYSALAFLALLMCLWAVPAAKIPAPAAQPNKAMQRGGVGLFVALFAVCLAVVARVLPYAAGAAIIFAVVLVYDKSLLRGVDYSLLFTFAAFFIFVGNLVRLPAVNCFLTLLVSGHEVIVGVLASQVLSNVPASVLLAGFTSQLPALIKGVNFGGLGTLIASMASLISFKAYARTEHPRMGRYMAAFTGANLAFLALMLGLDALLSGGIH